MCPDMCWTCVQPRDMYGTHLDQLSIPKNPYFDTLGKSVALKVQKLDCDQFKSVALKVQKLDCDQFLTHGTGRVKIC